jgi:uncharacterized membrane protein
MDKKVRSFAKTVSWRIIATFTTMFIVYMFTKKWAISLGVGIVGFLSKMLFYYVHERVWNKIGFGRK